jgi:hypothetical protein
MHHAFFIVTVAFGAFFLVSRFNFSAAVLLSLPDLIVTFAVTM